MIENEKDAEVLIRHKVNGFTAHVPLSLWTAHDATFKAEWDVLSNATAIDVPALAGVIAKVGGEQLGKLFRAIDPVGTLADAQTPPLEPNAPTGEA